MNNGNTLKSSSFNIIGRGPCEHKPPLPQIVMCMPPVGKIIKLPCPKLNRHNSFITI